MWRSIVDTNASNRYRKFGSIIPEDKVMQELYSVLHSGIYQPLQTQFYLPWHTQWGMSYTRDRPDSLFVLF